MKGRRRKSGNEEGKEELDDNYHYPLSFLKTYVCFLKYNVK